jgi:hypothetical protein
MPLPPSSSLKYSQIYDEIEREGDRIRDDKFKKK